MPEPRARRLRRWAWAAGALCVAGGVAGGVLAETVGASAGYRTAAATTSSVSSALTVSGTIDPVQQSTAAFGASGTVASVDVSLGQQVKAGQTLASLDPTTLQKEVTSAEANLHAAQATLTADESSQSDATDPSSYTGGTPAGTSPTGSPTSSAGTGTGTLRAAQQAVVGAQKTVDADERTASADLAQADSVCKGSVGQPGTGMGTGTGTGTTGTATGKGPQGRTGTPRPTGKNTGTSKTTGAPTVCTAALTAALAAEDEVAMAEKTVTKAETDLARILAAESRSSVGSRSATNGTSSTSSRGHSSTSTGTDTAAQLATDQAAIDSDDARLIEAQQSLAAATLTSPIGGTVVAVDLTVGESVTAGSSSELITVEDRNAFEALGSLTSTQVPAVKVGDTVDVSVDGVSGSFEGTVTRVGPVDVSSGDTYPLVVALRSSAATLFAGSTAELNVVVRQVHDALVVPTSAVHTDGLGRSYVLTLESGLERRTPVTVGVVGDVDTQIMSGLRRGATVVLADLTEPVPTSSGTTARFGALGALNGGTVHFSPGVFRGFTQRANASPAP